MKTYYAFLSVFGLIAIAASSQASDYTFTTLDYPGALDTYPHGVSGSTVVGSYQHRISNTAFHGFNSNGSRSTTLDPPKAALSLSDTYLTGVSGGTVAGHYEDSSYAFHGFIHNGSTFRRLDVPGADSTFVFGMFGGTIVGSYQGNSGPSHGFIYDGSTFTTLDVPGANGTIAQGVSGDTVVGTYADQSGNGHGFLAISSLPPVARCKHVTVSADGNCVADASIDDGSYSPNAGDIITLVQTPPGPYPLGDTSVTLTVTENHGLSNSCVATVTVVDATPPVVTCPDDIVTDATSPAGAMVSFTPTASDNCLLVSVTCSPASGSTFAIGETTVSCNAMDAAGNQAACTFTVHVKGAAEQVHNLIALVQNLGLQSGTANSLLVKLQSAASALARGNVAAAGGCLGALLNEANAQTGKKLTAAQADSLVEEATRIRAVLGSS